MLDEESMLTLYLQLNYRTISQSVKTEVHGFYVVLCCNESGGPSITIEEV